MKYAPYGTWHINGISKARHSTGSHFLEVKGQGRPSCSPSSWQSASGGELRPGSQAHSPSDLLCRRDAKCSSHAAMIAVLTPSRNFHFFVNSISSAHAHPRVVSRCNDFLINPISSAVQPRGDAGGGKHVGCI